jgi:hypothetical protein
METLKVTVSVATDDILDVLAWHEGVDYGWDRKLSARNDRFLAACQDADDEEKARLFDVMPPSLQWCVHEVERRGVSPLWFALSLAGVADPRTEAPAPAPLDVAAPDAENCGLVDDDEGACILAVGHDGDDHWYSMFGTPRA